MGSLLKKIHSNSTEFFVAIHPKVIDKNPNFWWKIQSKNSSWTSVKIFFPYKESCGFFTVYKLYQIRDLNKPSYKIVLTNLKTSQKHMSTKNAWWLTWHGVYFQEDKINLNQYNWMLCVLLTICEYFSTKWWLKNSKEQ